MKNYIFLKYRMSVPRMNAEHPDWPADKKKAYAEQRAAHKQEIKDARKNRKEQHLKKVEHLQKKGRKVDAKTSPQEIDSFFMQDASIQEKIKMHQEVLGRMEKSNQCKCTLDYQKEHIKKLQALLVQADKANLKIN